MKHVAIVWACTVLAAATADADVRIEVVPPFVRIGPKAAADMGPAASKVIDLRAPRNGIASAQVVVRAEEPFSGPSASASDLTGETGGRIPAEAVRLRYGRLGGAYVPLLDEPASGEALHMVWLTVRVPEDARPGAYRGKLDLRGPFGSRTVPIELRVHAWRVGDPHQWRTWVNLLQSPESVAAHYKVPRWSDRHFRLMEKSLALMGAAGNDVLGISAVRETVFGDDPMLVFRRTGDRWVPEFDLVERYLGLYDRHAGEPAYLALHVWSYGMYYRGEGRDGGKEQVRAETIPVLERRGGELVPVEMPIFGGPGTGPVWRAVVEGLKARFERLGWTRTRLLLGTGGDTWPSPETVGFFQTIAPDVRWRVLTHGCGCPKWGPTPLERTQPNGMVVGYLEIARRLTNHRDRLPGRPVVCNSRDRVGSDPFAYRGLASVTVFGHGYEGICWKGIDYWTYTTPEGTRRNALNTYVHFGNMVGGTPRAMCAPGPDGAVTTQQFEQLREGLQECEAMLAIRAGLDRLYPQPVTRCDVLQLVLKDALAREDRRRKAEGEFVDVQDLELSLRFRDGELLPEVRSKASTYNTGRHTARAKALPSSDSLRLEVEVTIADDPWIAGGTGTFVLDLERGNPSCTGRFEGAFNGHEREGPVIGTFVPNGYAVPTGEPRPGTEAVARAEAVIETAVGVVKTRKPDSRTTEAWPEALDRLYEEAAAIEASAAATQVSADPRAAK